MRQRVAARAIAWEHVVVRLRVRERGRAIRRNQGGVSVTARMQARNAAERTPQRLGKASLARRRVAPRSGSATARVRRHRSGSATASARRHRGSGVGLASGRVPWGQGPCRAATVGGESTVRPTRSTCMTLPATHILLLVCRIALSRYAADRDFASVCADVAPTALLCRICVPGADHNLVGRPHAVP